MSEEHPVYHENVRAEPAAPEPAPITAEDVQSDNAPEESLPDSSLIADRLRSLNEPQLQQVEQPPQPTIQQQDLEALRALRLGLQPKQEKPKPPSPEMKAILDRVEAMEQRNDALAEQYRQEARAREKAELYAQTVKYVKDNSEQFPLLNHVGHQGIAFQRMENTGASEQQATSQVEKELADIVHACAPLLGYTKSQVEQTSEEQVSVGTPALNGAAPVNIDDLDDDAAMAFLVKSAEKQQR